MTARLERKEILRRTVPPISSFVLSESSLYDRLGGNEVWRRQIDALRQAAASPAISVQIMRLGRSTHAGLSGPFVLLETPDHEHLAYAETRRGSLLISEPGEVSVLAQKYGMLRAQAPGVDDSKVLLDSLQGDA